MRTLVIFIMCSAGPAMGQELSAALADCAELSDDSARLACYDALLEPARESAVEPPAEPRSAPDADYGLRTPVNPDAQGVKQGTVRRVGRTGLGHLTFHLADGSVWRQLEARFFPYPREGEFEVEIERGPAGDYQLRVGGRGRMVRVRRIE